MPATLFYTRRFISGINTKFSCVLHTQKLKHATMHIRCDTCMHNTAYICDRIRENGLIAGLAKIDFFPEKPFTKFKYCLRKI